MTGAGDQPARADEGWEPPVVLSHREARQLLDARAAGAPAARASLDLGLTTGDIRLTPSGALLPDDSLLDWADIATIADHEEACFAVHPATGAGAARIERIGRFSEALGRHYSLYPTSGAPTMLIGGFSMHRIKGTDPLRDTMAKVHAAAPLRGRVLDTTTRLGYTAIAAAHAGAEEVVTIELDPTTLTIARYNPWSRDLFTHPRIRQIIGDSYDIVQGFPPESFSRIIHDPPIFSLAGELYSGAFYAQLFRILRRGGRLFHYIGNLDSKGSGGVARGAIRRLKEAGFARVDRHPDAFGVTAFKER